MKPLKIVLFHLIGLFMILCLHSLIFLKHHGREYRHFYTNDYYEEAETYFEDTIPRIEYLQDSTYKIVTDTIITIYKVKTCEKISTLPMFNEPIRSMAIHPSGRYLAVLGEYYLEVYDLIRDNLANTSTTMDLSDNNPGLDVVDMDYIEFSADGKYIMVIEYGDVVVKVYQWPGLKYLDTGYMGFRRNSFWWENHGGKLVFFYNENKYTYRTEFPSDSTEEFPSFSEPVCIDSVRIKE